MTFHNHSKQIVEDFLGTVAYVDDLIFSTRKEVQPEVVTFTTTIREAVASNEITEKVEKNIPKQLVPNIDPLVFSNAFIEKGIHCALLELSDDKSNIESIKKTLKKSDVIILDWQMHNDLGKCSTELVKFILTEDRVTTLSLRLLVIYTDQPNYNSLITENLIPVFDELQIVFKLNSDVEIQSGHTKIIVLQKPQINTKEDGKVSVEELPERIIEEMTLLTEGLVSNTALKAVTVIRRNSHNLLGAFNKDLDSAYLAHRAMLPIPEDAELLIKETIVASIDSIISYANINEACSQQKIEEWIDASPFNIKEINLATGKAKPIKVNISKDELKYWQKVGYKDFFNSLVPAQIAGKNFSEPEFISFERMKLKDKAIMCFTKDDGVIDGVNEEFAILTHHKSNLKSISYIPYLTLGAVIQKGEEYFLCVQQRCDSLRIPEGEIRSFLFLPLNEKEGSFPIVFKNDSGAYSKLRVNLSNCHYLIIEKFEPTYNGIVQARKEDRGFTFNSTDGNDFIWVLDLKDSHAQRIANKFASEFSRVGLDESEWLRRS